MGVLLVVVAFMLLLTPYIVCIKIDNAESDLKRIISDFEMRMKQQLEQLRLEIERIAASQYSPPEQETAPAIETIEPAPEDEPALEEAPILVSSAYGVSPDYEEAAVHAAAFEPAPEADTLTPAGAADTVMPPEPFRGPIHYEPPRKDQKPGVISLAFQKFYSWLLTEGNIWVCAGVLLFLVGFGLLFSYAIQRGVITLEMRLAGAAVTGLAMTWFGFRLRERRRAYALILQGGGMGVLYLVVLAAAKLPAAQPILSPTFSIIAMLALSVFTVLLALLQDYQPLALFAILGGFAAPVLVSTGSRNYVALFSIYTLLNFEILALSFKRDWRLLSRMGFILSISIGTAWGVRDWSPELFNSVEPFLLVFLATYTLIASAAFNKTRVPDLLLAIGAPFGFFALQTQVAGHFRYGMALTCLGLGLWHLLFGVLLRRVKEGDNSRKARLTLSNLYMFMCLLFSNLIAAYTLDNTAASAVWAVEGAFLTAAASRTGSYKALLAGIVLHTVALPFFCRDLSSLNWSTEAHLSPIFVSGTLFAFSFLCGGLFASRFRPADIHSSGDNALFDKWEEALQKILGEDGRWVRDGLSWVFTVVGSLWWWGTLYDQVLRLDMMWFSLFSAACLSALAGSWLSARFNWKAARFLLVCPIVWASFNVLYFSLEQFSEARFLLQYFGEFMITAGGRHVYIDTLMYAVCIGGSLYILRRAEKTFLSPFTMFAALLAGLYLTENAVQHVFNYSSMGMLLSIMPMLALLLYMRRFNRTLQGEGTVPFAWAFGVFLCSRAWRFFGSFGLRGAAAGDMFIPILNPLELWQAALLFSLFLCVESFLLEGRKFGKWPKLPKWVFAALVFAWINQAAARASWHYWIAASGGMSYYSLVETLRAATCQALIAIVWGVLGLGSILYGQKTRSRDLWCTGAALIAADMVKLFLVDLNRSATLVRITAFLVLGGLALLIGWIAPLPPKKENEDNAE